MYTLAIETSCDDTSVAIIDQNRQVHCNLVASQDLVHQPFGGVVPEIASRNHTADLLPLVEQALQKATITWNDIHGIAVTNRPGLIGSLIVGMVTAKSLALAFGKPFLGVHHIEGHIMAPFLVDQEYRGPDFFNERFIAMVVSGGHTQLYLVNGFGNYQTLGETNDDAAGEAFDKFAKMLGLGYPGGVLVDRQAKLGNATAYNFPRPLIGDDDFNFSFSGLKSSAQRLVAAMAPETLAVETPNLCASYQKAIVDVLRTKLEKAVRKHSAKYFIVSGGVSANSGLRQAVAEIAAATGAQMALPPLRYCTDNAAMIGLVGMLRMQKGEYSTQDLPPIARVPL